MNNKFEKCLIDSAEELESEGIQNAKEIALEILEKKNCVTYQKPDNFGMHSENIRIFKIAKTNQNPQNMEFIVISNTKFQKKM